jgi:hypothetical protein
LLPVSGITLALREPSGSDELYVAETAAPPALALLHLARRMASAADGGTVDWPGLPAADLDAAALIIRRAWLGELISTDCKCPDPDCLERIDVSFRIGDYLRHHRPRRPRGVTESADGWLALAGKTGTVRFRIPTIADLLAARAEDQSPADALTSRCVDPPGISAALARRLDRALSALAPSLTDLVGGTCPACGRQVALCFDPVRYVMADLREACAGIHAEIHAIAATYQWSEPAILALPRHRRRQYAALIAAERAAA